MLLLCLALGGCTAAREKEIRIWVAENTADFTRQQAERFMAAHP